MTTVEQIIKLSELGYSKEEITAFMQPQAPVQTQPQAPVQTQPQAPVQTQPAQEITNNNQVDFLEALKLLGQSMAQPAQTQPQAPAQTQPQAPAQTQPQAPAQTQPQAPAQTQPQAPAQTQPQAQQPISLSVNDLVKLTQGIAVQTAAGSIETPKSANDIILGMLDAYESTTKKEE